MASNSSIVDRAQHWVAENKRVVILGTAAVVAVAGVVYYASTSRGPDGDLEKGKRSKKGSKSSSKRKTGKDQDGPILEEISPKTSVSEAEEDKLTAEVIVTLPTEERLAMASGLKGRGNTAYQQRKFDVAAALYSRAIDVSPSPEPVFYSNRAACYINMAPPKFELVVEDCNQALALDPNYVKALNRRATALEALDRLEESLRDFTAATILQKFQDASAAQSVERVLKTLAQRETDSILAVREPRLPPHTFVSSYFAAFRKRAIPALPENPSTGDETLHMALGALEAADYIHAFTLCNEAIDQGISTDAGKAEALNVRGTFKFLIGDITASKEDLLASIDLVPEFTQSLVKLASVHMEQGNPTSAFECFEEAIKHKPNDPDIYYHRGQVLFIMNEFARAADDYIKSTELDDQFVFTHIQLAVAQYKSENIANSMATFRRTLKAFPDRSEPHNYYGELLLDQQRFQDAVDKFERAIELEKAKTSLMNVLPLVNKGLALYQWKQDIKAAEECCHEALALDPDCEAAVATLAQLSLQQSDIPTAVKMFERQAELARSEPELVNALTYKFASAAQAEFLKNYPGMAAELSSIAKGMQG